MALDQETVRQTLRSTFGYQSFRPLQEEIVETILARRDVLVLMPTGGGKSLCFQLPALLLSGTTIVVSPLIALMKDQVDALRTLGAPATYINSSLSALEISRRQAAATQGKVKLLYVAPERLMTEDFLRLLERIRPAFFAIDEAHCISEWGHDFRPEYRQLRQLRALFPGVPMGAFTATATPRVQADIREQLELQDAPVFSGSFNRSNLIYQVWPKRDAYAQLTAYLRSRPDASGIIYCFSRAGTEDLARQLQRDGFSAAAYHAGLENEERRRRQEAFVKDDVRIIVATIAFGMGIDKPDVRFVIHYDLPKTIENYYQESGRAGRDGDPSDCILFYSRSDFMKQRRFIDEKESAEERRIASWQLQQMTNWAESATCRRAALLAYFDEVFEGQEEPCCDICQDGVETEDFTTPAQMFLSCVKRTGESFGATHIIDVLRASRSQKIVDRRHDQLSTYGIGRDRSKEEWHHIARQLIVGGYLHQDPTYGSLSVTERGRDVLFGGERAMLAPFAERTEGKKSPDTPHADLFERLRALRKRLADERHIPPYVIFHDGTLRHLAASMPSTPAEFRRVPGVGDRKASDLGPAFLAEIAAYARETGATPAPLPEPEVRPRSRNGMSQTVLTSLDMFRQGNDVTTIARARSLTPTTIEGHLADAILAGERLDVDQLIAPQKRRSIEAAMVELGSGYLGPVKERLGDAYSYGELRLVQALLQARAAR